MKKTKLLVGLGIIVLLAVSLGFYFSGKSGSQPKFHIVKLERGDIVATVTASGTLAAVTTVNVGSQVSGIISHLYVDFNSPVKKDQLIAELDPTPFQAVVDQRRADLDKANVEMRNTNVSFERSKNLLDNGLIAKSDYDTAEANLLSAKASVKQAEAALRQAETNVTNTKILSPIDGTVISRQYDIGQTVAASFQAPTLFTIAKDLTLMQVSTSIDEADVGRVKTGEDASFTVDAFADRTYHGKISQIRLSPQVVNNVVTYTVMIDVPNPNMDLKPGMTANVIIPVESKDDVIKIPNAALRFKPDPADIEKTVSAEGGHRKQGGTKPEGQSSGQSGTAGKKERPKQDTVVYVMNVDGKLSPIPIKGSITDGSFTALESGNLKEGDSVVTGLETSKAMESTGGFGQQQRPRGTRM